MTPRLRIEPEAQALWWENCIDEGPPRGVDCRDGTAALLGASLVVDLGDPTARTVVYSIGGGGVLPGATEEPFFYLQGGLGMRAWISRRFFLAPETRLSFPHAFQLTASAGFPVR